MLHAPSRFAFARQGRVALFVPALIALCLSGPMTSTSVHAAEPPTAISEKSQKKVPTAEEQQALDEFHKL